MLSEKEITVWACQIPEAISEGLVNEALRRLPEFHQSYISSFKKRDDQLTRLTGRLLWRKVLLENDLPFSAFEHPTFGPHGKPMEVGFGLNISHSADLVLMAFSGQQAIGVDVERIRKVDIPSFTKQFSKCEIASIVGREDTEAAFFEAWTRKESVVKALGKGLTKKLIEIEADDHGCFEIDQVIWHTQSVAVPEGFKAHLATTMLCTQNYQTIDFRELV
jgi:4'-phosphopantetheinyl transferase